jgi:putative hydrolase of the HAD superfamily
MDRPDQQVIKAIIFDFGDVLTAPVDRAANEAHRVMLAQKLNVPSEELWTYLFEGEPSRKWMTGLIDWDEFWSEVLAPKGITDPAEVEAFASIVFSGTDKLNPEMMALLNDLHGRYKLAVLSNASWTAEELEKILYNDHEVPQGFFDVVVTSTSAGAVKPDRDIFQYVLTALNVRPEEAVFTDDLPNFIDAASGLGIHARLFTSPDNFRAFLRELGVL